MSAVELEPAREAPTAGTGPATGSRDDAPSTGPTVADIVSMRMAVADQLVGAASRHRRTAALREAAALYRTALELATAAGLADQAERARDALRRLRAA